MRTLTTICRVTTGLFEIEQQYRAIYMTTYVLLYSKLKRSNKMQQYADIYLLLNYSTYFGHPSRPSSGVYKTVVAASVLLTQYCAGDKIEKNEMGWACGAYGWGEGAYRVLVGKPEGKRPLGRLRRRWVDNIRMDLQEVGCGYVDWIGLA